MKEEFLERIRRKREELDLSIEEIVEKTKLHPSVIKSIEEGKWEEINPTYLKGFLKIYCNFLGVEFDEEILGKKESPSLVSKKKEVKTFETIKLFRYKPSLGYLKRRPYLIRGIIFGLIFLVIFLFLVVFGKKFFSPEKKPSWEEEIKKFSFPLKDKIHVSIRAKKDCFLRVKENKKVVFEGILKKDMVESWQADELEFKISDGSAVEIEVNGKMLPPLSRLPRPIRSLKITHGSISVVK